MYRGIWEVLCQGNAHCEEVLRIEGEWHEWAKCPPLGIPPKESGWTWWKAYYSTSQQRHIHEGVYLCPKCTKPMEQYRAAVKNYDDAWRTYRKSLWLRLKKRFLGVGMPPFPKFPFEEEG